MIYSQLKRFLAEYIKFYLVVDEGRTAEPFDLAKKSKACTAEVRWEVSGIGILLFDPGCTPLCIGWRRETTSSE